MDECFLSQDIDGEGNIWVTDVGLHQVIVIETMQIIELTMKIITTINKIMTVIIDVHQVMKFPAGATKPSLGEETISSSKSILAVQ